MSGQFSPTVRPLRPGAYFDFQAATPQPVFVNTLGIVALPFTHSWGPANTIVPLYQFSDFLTVYSQGGTTPPAFTAGYTAMRQCFQGEGLPGRGGAGEVLGYRMVGSGGVASFTALQNTTPAAAITLTAVYQGTFGNNISVSVVVNARNPTTQLDLNVYVQGFMTETFSFNKTDVTALGALINDPNHGSKWVVASAITSGVLLATVTTPVSLTGGNDGATLVSGDWTAALAAFGVARFGTFAPFDLVSAPITASVVAWQAVLNTAGKRFMTVIGGAANDTATSAIARSALINDPNVINIGVGTFTDSVLGALDTSQLVPRLAGIIASRTEKQGLSFARLAGVSIVAGASDADILASLQGGGFMTLSRDSNADAPVRFEKGLTTFTTPDAARPVWAYSNPKFVLTMQNLENELTQWAEANVIGRLPVDDKSIAEVLGQLAARLKARENNEIIQAGWTVIQNPVPTPTPQDDFIAVLYGISFIRDMEQILSTVVVS